MIQTMAKVTDLAHPIEAVAIVILFPLILFSFITHLPQSLCQKESFDFYFFTFSGLQALQFLVFHF